MKNTSQVDMVDVREAQGKTLVVAFHDIHDQHLLLVWSDGTASQVGLDLGWETMDTTLCDLPVVTENDYHTDKLLESGMIDQDWVDYQQQCENERLRIKKEREEAMMREQYEQLKQRFEPQVTTDADSE